MPSRRFLITGGAGFIGSALVDRLVADVGNEVVVADNLSTGYVQNVSSKARLVEIDVADTQAVEALFTEERFDVVCHLAAQVSNIVSHEDPQLDMRTNALGTVNIVEGVIRHGVPRLLYASSMAVYGTKGDEPVLEGADLDPLSPYAVSKLAGEQLVHNAARRTDVTSPPAVTSLRMFNVYGPRQSLENSYQGVASVFLARALEGSPIVLYGDGQQSRDFVFIDDVVDAWMQAMDEPRSHGLRINVGSGEAVTINELLEAVLGVAGYEVPTYPIDRQPALPGDQRAIRANISNARRLLDWGPRSSLADGLSATVAWAKSSSLVDDRC